MNRQAATASSQARPAACFARVLAQVLLGSLLVPAAAQAEVMPLARNGAWTSFGGQADDGRPVCGLGRSGADGRTIVVRWLQGSNHLDVILGRREWHIPDGMRAEVWMQFDDASPWRVIASGAGARLAFNIPLSRVDAFEQEFRQAGVVKVWFPNASEPGWIGSMAGSSAAMTSMVHCLAALTRAEPDPAPDQTARPTSPTPRSPVEDPFLAGPSAPKASLGREGDTGDAGPPKSAALPGAEPPKRLKDRLTGADNIESALGARSGE